MKDYVVMVDKRGVKVGLVDKVYAHQESGILHRAFSVFVFNSDKKLLIQKRSNKKMLWPRYWSNTCCSHPRDGEDFVGAGKRRLFEELGFDCDLRHLYDFGYKASYRKDNGVLVGTERELCSVLIGRSDEKPNMDLENVRDEICDFGYIGLDELRGHMFKNSENYTPWFKMEVFRMVRDYGKNIEELFV